MKFKDVRTKAEFNDPRLKSDVRIIAFALTSYVQYKYGRDIEITDVFYQRGEFNSITPVHEEWRGIDCVLRGMSMEEGAAIEAWVNENFKLAATGMLACVFHEAGYGLHFHLQVSIAAGTQIARINDT